MLAIEHVAAVEGPLARLERPGAFFPLFQPVHRYVIDRATAFATQDFSFLLAYEGADPVDKHLPEGARQPRGCHVRGVGSAQPERKCGSP